MYQVQEVDELSVDEIEAATFAEMLRLLYGLAMPRNLSEKRKNILPKFFKI
jgi:hypothetical protein